MVDRQRNTRQSRDYWRRRRSRSRPETPHVAPEGQLDWLGDLVAGLIRMVIGVAAIGALFYAVVMVDWTGIWARSIRYQAEKESSVWGPWRKLLWVHGSDYPMQYVKNVTISADGRRIDLGPKLTLGADGQLLAMVTQRSASETSSDLRVWNTRERSELWSREIAYPHVAAMAVSPQGDKLAVLHGADEGNGLSVWGFDGDGGHELLWKRMDLLVENRNRSILEQAKSGRSRKELFLLVHDMVFSADGTRLLLCGDGVRVWNAKDGSQVEILAFCGTTWRGIIPVAPFEHICRSKDGQVLAAVGWNRAKYGESAGQQGELSQRVMFWDREPSNTWRERNQDVVIDDLVRGVGLSEDGRVLAMYCRKEVVLVDAANGMVLQQIEHHKWHHPLMLFSRDGSLLLLGQGETYDEPGALEIWRVSDGSLVYNSKDSDKSTVPWHHLAGVALAPDGSIMLSCYGQQPRNRLQKEFLGASGKGVCAVYVWQTRWSSLFGGADERAAQQRELITGQ